MTDAVMPCHWTHRHGAHDWTPLVADPEQPRVLHLLGVTVRCPGKRGERPSDNPTSPGTRNGGGDRG